METCKENTDKKRGNKQCNKFKQRFMKRKWEETSKDKIRNGELEEKKSMVRIKKKKMALLLGYSGVDYSGMQRNPGVKTIEEDLLKALLGAKYITDEDFNEQQRIDFQRSSRTDKGVSAARQVVSLKLPLEVNIDEINSRLPNCIRVFGIKRVTNRFNSKTRCNARTYSYTFPTYVLESSLADEEQRKKYRVTPAKLDLLKNVLDMYKGTKSYHNFTIKKSYLDPSANRYMMGFNVDNVFVEDDMEFAVLLVKGQSFMLHQIRKMVGLAIAICRGVTDMSMMEKVFSKEKMTTPTAPGLGLVLDKVHYDKYDDFYKEVHGSLSWDAEEEMIEKFKRNHIYPSLVKGEIDGNSMGHWLKELDSHSFEPRDDTRREKDEKEIADDGYDDDDDDDIGDGDDSVKGNKNDENEVESNKANSVTIC